MMAKKNLFYDIICMLRLAEKINHSIIFSNVYEYSLELVYCDYRVVEYLYMGRQNTKINETNSHVVVIRRHEKWNRKDNR